MWQKSLHTFCIRANIVSKSCTMSSPTYIVSFKVIGIQTKLVEILMKEELNTLWEKGILETHCSRPCCDSYSLSACLREDREHRQLWFPMFQRAPRGWAYTEASPKNRPRGASVLKVSRKEFVIFAVPEGEHCPVFILDTYMERVPPSANSQDTCLHLRPMPSRSELWSLHSQTNQLENTPWQPW